jgi:hypothetical protein
VYLDVGRWGGHGGGEPHFPRCRNFGIVCGKTAVFCEFRPQGGSGQRTVNPAQTNPAEAAAINAVLAALQEVHVVDAHTSTTPVPVASVAPNEVFVFLGDMHLPVTTNAAPGHVNAPQMGRFEIDDALHRERTRLQIDIHQAAINTAAGRAPALLRPYILRMGPARTGYAGAVGVFDVNAWLTSYNNADIFEDADADLEVFVDRLEAYQARNGATVPAHLMQLGDMFDFWVGMLCHFVENPSTSGTVMLDGTFSGPTAMEFVDYWANTTAYLTARSHAVVRVLGYRGPKKFLYGNHDNYFSPTGYVPPAVIALSGQRRAASFEKALHFFSEHGHRNDSFNKDGARKGWAMTQSAFRVPAVRNFEPSSRLDRLKDASDLWIQKNNANAPFAVYVMGHTHVGCLTRVTIRDR